MTLLLILGGLLVGSMLMGGIVSFIIEKAETYAHCMWNFSDLWKKKVVAK